MIAIIVSFLAIIPLEKLSDYGGEQMAFYLGAVSIVYIVCRYLLTFLIVSWRFPRYYSRQVRDPICGVTIVGIDRYLPLKVWSKLPWRSSC